MRFRLLVSGLFASAVAIVMLISSPAAWATDVNVLNLSLSHAESKPIVSLSMLSDSDLDLGTNMTDTITITVDLTDTHKIAEAITEYFSGTLTTTVTVSDVVGLHDEGWGFGEIFRLYLLAQGTGMKPDQIKVLRDGGMGWGEIAQSLNLSPGNKGKNLGAAVSGRGAEETPPVDGNGADKSHGNPHGGPPGKSGEDSPPAGKGNGKGK